jgi:hypothetical protein
VSGSAAIEHRERPPLPSARRAHAVAAALGHRSVTTTLQSYAKAGAGTSARQQKVLTVLSGGKEGREHAA